MPRSGSKRVSLTLPVCRGRERSDKGNVSGGGTWSRGRTSTTMVMSSWNIEHVDPSELQRRRRRVTRDRETHNGNGSLGDIGRNDDFPDASRGRDEDPLLLL
jgi:hypothetical protein